MLVKKLRYFLICLIVSLFSCDSADKPLMTESGNADYFAPEFVKFEASYVGERRIKTVTVENTSDEEICIETVRIFVSDDETEVDTFKIVAGWNSKRKYLKPESQFDIDISFNPQSLGDKSARLNLYASNMFYDIQFSLRGKCCPELQFKTPTKLPDAEEFIAYNLTFEAEGGSGNYTYTLDESTTSKRNIGKGFLKYFAFGLNLEINRLIGEPQESGFFEIGLILQDDAGHSTSKVFRLIINDGKFAHLGRTNMYDDKHYVFIEGDNKGQYTVNLQARCKNRRLTINTIELAGSGYDSGEAKITKMPELPLRLKNNEKIQIIVSVESKLDKSREVELIVHHDGDKTVFREEFAWSLSSMSKYVLVLNRSQSMSKSMCEKYSDSDSNGNVIPYPSKWQAVQSEAASVLMQFTERVSFDLIAFGSEARMCFASLKEGNMGNIGSAIGWMYNFEPQGESTGFHEALKLAFNNYDEAQHVFLFTDEMFTLDFSNIFKLICDLITMDRLYKDIKGWVQKKRNKYDSFKFHITYISDEPSFFIEELGKLPNTTCRRIS